MVYYAFSRHNCISIVEDGHKLESVSKAGYCIKKKKDLL